LGFGEKMSKKSAEKERLRRRHQQRREDPDIFDEVARRFSDWREGPEMQLPGRRSSDTLSLNADGTVENFDQMFERRKKSKEFSMAADRRNGYR